ncbi:hypothetical protein [Nitrososphaera sp. AFS]|uniref:hypothetical protein n=1 Tax=Nitrososphaera sp. AFS TaxID=2301191 RepID=UPI0013922735|nr:hypothetical protein [Nitrososphaera sp. AFS]NAL78052.1 hypothetical protein [Nitrososphaera sp. AFS]
MADDDSVIKLELTDKLKQEQVVSRYEYYLRTGNIVIQLNHKYDKKLITSPLESDWPKTIQTLEKQLKRRGVNPKLITMLTDSADNNAEVILGNLQSIEEEIENNIKTGKEKKYYIQKYRGKDFLAEAVIVAGTPFFATNNDGTIKLEESVQEYNETFLPLTNRMYLNRPYVFKSKQEFDDLLEKAKTETLDGLYKSVKSEWQKYNAADDNEISLCTADTIYTYKQDSIGMTHYLFFVGMPESGKSNRLLVFNLLAYRNMFSADMTPSNIFRFLGPLQEGQGTICEDEADDLDESPQKMKIYKSGYTTGIRVTRNDDETSTGRRQDGYCTFGFKAFAAEKLPDSIKAKGFRERTVEIKCQAGSPKYDILEVANAAQEEEFEDQLNEINRLRNILLLFRLLHNNDKIPNIKLNIANREKQLFKPILRIFQDTKTSRELLPVVSHFVRERRSKNIDTFHSFLYRVIKQLTSKGHYQLATATIWQTIKNSLPGSDIPKRPLSYESSEYGTISQKQITEILMTDFSADRPKHRGKSKELVFKEEKLRSLDKKFNVNLEVTVGESDESHESDAGLDGYITQKFLDEEIEGLNDESESNSDIQDKNVEKTMSTEVANTSSNVSKATHATHPTQTDAHFSSPFDSKPPPRPQMTNEDSSQ